MRFDIILRGGTCVFPWGEEAADIGVRDGRIASLAVTARADAHSVIDASGLHILPGLIDSHVHLRDPGDPAVETMNTGTRAAVLGGLCAVFDMPNTDPAIDTLDRLAQKRIHATRESWCDIGLYVAGTKGNVADLAALEAADGVCAIKVFAASTRPELLVDDDAALERVMRAGRRTIAYHSEDEPRLQARRRMFRSGEPHRRHMDWHDVECAALGTRRILALARRTGRPAHILHVSTAEELDLLRDHRDIASVEVLVNQLTQIGPDCYDRLGGYAVMNPPIRDRRHFDACWAALRDGLVDTVGSDHAPHSRAAKERPWPDCAAGLTGVQTIVPVMLDHVSAGRLSLARLADLMAAGPARVYGIVGKGRLAAGYDADFTLVDMKRRRRIEDDWIASPCGWSPFSGMTVTGWPVMTVIRGSVVMREDEVLGSPRGRPVRFR